jgi:hypothetical protein
MKIINIFIGGCPRSGTTYFAKVLSSYLKDAVVIPEVQYKYDLINYLQNNEKFDSNKIDTIITKYKNRTGLDYGFFKNENFIGKSMYEVYSYIYQVSLNNILGKNEPKYVIDHTPSNSLIHDFQSKAFPNYNFISIVRDPRAVYNSFKSLKWGPSRISSFIKVYTKYVETFSNIEYPKIRYEDLIINEKFTMNNINIKIALEKNRTGSKFIKLPDFTLNQHLEVNKPANKTRINNWQFNLNNYEIYLIESKMKNLFKINSYKYISPNYNLISHMYYLINSIKKMFRKKIYKVIRDKKI